MALAAAENPYGASWENGRILLGQFTPRGIVEIPANGGDAKHLVMLNESTGERATEPAARRGRTVRAVYIEPAGGAAWDDSSIVVQDLSTGERKVLLKGGTDARWPPRATPCTRAGRRCWLCRLTRRG